MQKYDCYRFAGFDKLDIITVDFLDCVAEIKKSNIDFRFAVKRKVKWQDWVPTFLFGSFAVQ